MAAKKKRQTLFSMFRSRSVLFRIILVQVALALGIAAVLMVFFRGTYVSRYREQVINTDLTMLNHLGNQIHKDLNIIETKTTDILSNPEVDRAIIDGGIWESAGAINIALMLDRLVEEEPLAGYAALWLRESNALIASDETVTELTGDSRAGFLLQGNIEPENSQGLILVGEDLYLVKNLPRHEPLATLAVWIDKAVLRNQMGADLDEAEGERLSLFAYLGDKPLFAEMTDYPDAGGLMIVDRQAAGRGDEICRMAEGDRMLLAHTLPESGIRLLGILSWKTVAYSLSEWIRSILPALAAAIAIILVTAWILLRVAYRPIGGLARDMMDQRTADSPRNLAGVQDEFDLIRSLYQEQKDYEKELAATLQKAGRTVTDKLLWDVIQENEAEEENTRRILAQIQSDFRTDMAYGVILLENMEKEGTEAAERMLHRIMVREFCMAYWRGRNPVSLPETPAEQTTVILGFEPDVSAKSAHQQIKQFLEDLSGRFRDYPFRPLTGTGPLGAGIFSLPSGYQEARKHLQENRYYDSSREEGKERSALSAYRNRFYNCLENLQQDPDGGSSELKEMLHSAGSYSESLQTIYLTIIDCMIEFMTRHHIPTEEDSQQLKRRLMEAGPEAAEADFGQSMEDFLNRCLEKLGHAQTNEQRRYLENAIKYMEEHYDDSMLSLALVGEKCGISGGYLSRLFARLSKENFTDTLNRCRVEQACRLLSQTELTIADIGLRTGFNSPQNFIRVFKKYMGITPGQYRNGGKP